MDKESKDQSHSKPENQGRRRDRPDMPVSYGLHPAKDGKDLLPWQWLTDRLEAARNYWLGTTRPNGQPHSMPIWGVWLADQFYFGTGLGSRKARNLETNPAAVLHLESGDEVVILEGWVKEVPSLEELGRYADAYYRKYDFRPDPADPHSRTYRLRPKLAFAWLESDFPRTATRWEFAWD